MKRHRCAKHRPRPLRYLTLSVVLLLLLVYVQPVQTQTGLPNSEIIQVNPYYSYFVTTLEDGTPITANIIDGPSEPPLGEITNGFDPIPTNTPTGIISNFPSYSWVFGCSAVSGTMIAAYYDRGEYTNIYSGATNGGVYPLTDSGFGTWTDSAGSSYPNNPLVASKQGVDGLTVRGSINDYWVSYGSTAADPYITGDWSEHTTKTSVGDWMGTSQSAKSNTDGATAFYSYSNSTKLHCDSLTGYNPPDGNWGRREFYTSRGYASTDCYNQKTDNAASGGFSFANYKAEIDAGHPVMIHLEGHTIVGYGYADPSTVYIRDTWSSNTSENRYMTWGGSYEGMAMNSVSILHLQSTALPPTNITLSASSIPENSPINTTIGTFTTTDPNLGNTFTYTLVSGSGDTGNSSFNISGNTLRSSVSFNYEAAQSFSIRVRTTDNTSQYFEKIFTITVTNVNEAPTNISLSASTIPENSSVNTTIGTLSATDPDGGTFTYSLVSGTGSSDNSSFNISGTTLRNSAMFDYETQSTYSIRVRVTDQGSLTYEKIFTITVTNVNEAPTNISLSASTIAENSAVNTTIGTLSATDPDGGTFTYSLVSGTGDSGNSSFNISGTSLRNSAVFDYETQSTYSIRVRVTDQGSLTYEKIFTITVTNVNEAPTNISLSASTIAENSAVNTTIGTFSATDPDSGGSFTYSLVSGTGDSGNSSFNISGTSLRNSALFNYETQSTYSIRVRVTDQGSLTYEKTFTITVTNVNEAPTNISLSASTIPENSPVNTTIGTFSATDPDSGGSFTYSLVSGTGDSGNSSFNISGTSLRNSVVFDYETQNSYSIRVRVTDQGSLTYEKNFTITVTNVNQAPTDISLTATTIAENSSINTIVGTLSASDPNANDTFVYQLVSGNGDSGNASFNINGAALRSSAIFDYETQTTYSIRVRVTDQGSLTFEKTFTITVTNINEAPVGLSLSNNMIPEGQPIDTEVGLFTTQDPDNDSQFTYALISGEGDTDNSLFTISGNSLRTAEILDYQTQQTLSIRVITSDQGSLTYVKTFTIHVVNGFTYLFLPLILK